MLLDKAVAELASLLLATAAQAQPIAADHLICVGEGACSEATTQRCSVALGKNVQVSSSHVLATPEGERLLLALDDILVERINGALPEYARLWRPDWHVPRLDPYYVKDWNRACAAGDTP